MQMILPQFIQLGAASRSGWRVAIQLHFRLLLSCPDDSVGFVWISSARIADSRSVRAVDAPCIGVPPGTLTLALGFGDEFREGFSEMRCPAADGGSLGAAWVGGGVEAVAAGGAGEIPRDLGVEDPDVRGLIMLVM